MNKNIQIILVTGASSGIGREICLRLIEDGAFVIASGRDIKRLNELKERREVLKELIKVDEQIDQVAQEINKQEDERQKPPVPDSQESIR